MDRTPENLENISMQNQQKKDKYTPRPIGHLIWAWILIAIVLFAFFGTCYWMINYGRV